MFVEDSEGPVSATRVHQLIRKIKAAEHSPHSSKIIIITLACQCLATGMSEPQTLAICWQSTESLKIYARMGAQDYANILNAAGSAEITTITSQTPEQSAPHPETTFIGSSMMPQQVGLGTQLQVV